MADTEPKSCSVGACGSSRGRGAGRLETKADCGDAVVYAGKEKSGGGVESGVESGIAGYVVCGGLRLPCIATCDALYLGATTHSILSVCLAILAQHKHNDSRFGGQWTRHLLYRQAHKQRRLKRSCLQLHSTHAASSEVHDFCMHCCLPALLCMLFANTTQSATNSDQI